MIRVFVVACLLAVTAAQRTYYCGITSSITDQEFYFITRSGLGDVSYPAGLFCELNLTSPGIGVMLDIESFRVQTAVLTVTEASGILFSGSSLPNYKSSIVASSGYMRIRFNSTGDYSGLSGVRMRIRLFDNNRCPSGWTNIFGQCFGTSNITGRLNYTDAQKACNSMRANLLQIPPSSYHGSVRAFMRVLPAHLRLSFIGLTDRANRFVPYWLNGVRQNNTSEVSCLSTGSYPSCYPHERCATFSDIKLAYAIYMDSCTSVRDYACSMPPGGTQYFYTVPDVSTTYPTPVNHPVNHPVNRPVNQDHTVNTGVIVGAVIGSLCAIGFIIGCFYCIYIAIRSNAIISSAIQSNSRVAVRPPNIPYPVQPHFQQPIPPMSSTQGPFYPAGPPPAYGVAVSAAYNCDGNEK